MRRSNTVNTSMERNLLKTIDVTQYMLFESSGDSDVKSDLNTPSSGGNINAFSTFDRRGSCDRNDDHEGSAGNADDDDAESCSYDSSYGECVDGFCPGPPGYRDNDDKGFVVNKHDGGNCEYNYYGSCYNQFRRISEDEEMEDGEDAIDSKLMVAEEELPKKKKTKNDLCTDDQFMMAGIRAAQNKRSQDYCSSMDFLNNQKETDKNFWDTCLAS